jgi:hypothetical protein
MADRMNPYHNPNFARGISNIGKLLAGSAQEDANIALGRQRDALALQQEDRYAAIQELAGGSEGNEFTQRFANELAGAPVDPRLSGAFFRAYASQPVKFSGGFHNTRMIAPSIAEADARTKVSTQQAALYEEQAKAAGDPYSLLGLQDKPAAVERALLSLGGKVHVQATDPENYALLKFRAGRAHPERLSTALAQPELTAAEVKLLEAQAAAQNVSSADTPLTREVAKAMLPIGLGDVLNVQPNPDTGQYSEADIALAMKIGHRTEFMKNVFDARQSQVKLEGEVLKTSAVKEAGCNKPHR